MVVRIAQGGSSAGRPTNIDQYQAKYSTPSGSRVPPVRTPGKITSPSAPPAGYSTGPGTYNPRFAAPAPTTNVNTNTTSSQNYPQASQMSFGGGGAGAPVFDPNTEYLNEAGYLAQISALDEALGNFNSQDVKDRGAYDLDFKKGLGDLGYKDENIDDDIAGQWDWNDILTASGRGYQNNINDFAGRGMAQSQAYLDAQDSLARSLEDQRGAMGTARGNFQREKNVGLANYGTQDKAARAQAAAAAIQRLSDSLGLG